MSGEIQHLVGLFGLLVVVVVIAIAAPIRMVCFPRDRILEQCDRVRVEVRAIDYVSWDHTECIVIPAMMMESKHMELTKKEIRNHCTEW